MRAATVAGGLSGNYLDPDIAAEVLTLDAPL
jgi:hypothetical protein